MMLKTLIYYAVTFIFTILLGGLQQGTGVSEQWVILPQLAPGLSALILSFAFYRRFVLAGSKDILPANTIVSFLLPILSAWILFGVVLLLEPGLELYPLTLPSTFMFLWMPIGAAGEEIGWRGFMDRELGQRFSLPLRALIGGALWALWHVGQYSNGFVFFLFFILLMVSYRYVLGLLTMKGFPLLCAVLFHWAVNLGNILVLPIIGSLYYIVPLSLSWFIIAVFFYFIFRRKEWGTTT